LLNILPSKPFEKVIPLRISLADTSHFLRCSSMETFSRNSKKPKQRKQKNFYLSTSISLYITLQYYANSNLKHTQKRRKEGMKKKHTHRRRTPIRMLIHLSLARFRKLFLFYFFTIINLVKIVKANYLNGVYGLK